MTDLRSRLADALRAHYLWDECYNSDGHIARCRCDVDEPSITNGVPDGGWMTFDAYFTHVASELLSLPGIAIVDTESDIDRVAKALCNGYFDADDGWDRCVVEYGRELWRRSARAALAAAAVQAQEEQ